MLDYIVKTGFKLDTQVFGMDFTTNLLPYLKKFGVEWWNMTSRDLRLGPKAINSLHACLHENLKKIEASCRHLIDFWFFEKEEPGIVEPLR